MFRFELRKEEQLSNRQRSVCMILGAHSGTYEEFSLVVQWKSTNASEEYVASIFRV
jgi:hypothetical protein